MKRKLSSDISEVPREEPKAPTYYTIEKILKTRTLVDGSKECLIKWLGYSNSWNSWEPSENILTETYPDDSVSESESENKKNVKNSKKTVKAKTSNKYRSIVVGHKISKKRLELILAKIAKRNKMNSNENLN